MSVEHVLKTIWTPGNGGASLPASSQRQSGTLSPDLDISIAAGAVDVAQPWPVVNRANIQAFFLTASQPCTVKTNSPGINAVFGVTMSGGPGGGTFTMTAIRPDTLASTTATAIPYNATLAQFQTALNTVYGSGNSLATGGPFPGTPFSVALQGALAAYPITLPTFNNAGLTGGSSPAAAASNTTTGVRWGNKWVLPAGIAVAWGKDDPAFSNPVAADIVNLYVTVPGTVAASLRGRALTS